MALVVQTQRSAASKPCINHNLGIRVIALRQILTADRLVSFHMVTRDLPLIFPNRAGSLALKTLWTINRLADLLNSLRHSLRPDWSILITISITVSIGITAYRCQLL